MSPLDRFWLKVQRTPDCWIWNGRLLKRTQRAYFDINGKRVIAARWLWQQTRGPLRDGECVLHRCDNPRCVNPDHLFIGSQLDNIRDRDRKGHTRLRSVRCINGHPFTPENTRFYGPNNRWRICRACARDAMRKHRLITREEAEAY